MDARLRDPCAELENTNILDGRSSPKEDSLFGAKTDSTVTFHSLYITSFLHTSKSYLRFRARYAAVNRRKMRKGRGLLPHAA